MKATIFHAPGDVRIEKVPDPTIKEPTDAVVRVTHACICGVGPVVLENQRCHH